MCDSIPDPAQLPEPQANQWLSFAGPVSQRTAPSGDWNTFPHMQSKDSWKDKMGRRAELVDNFLQQRNISVDGCKLCKDHGVGHPGNWSGHIASQRHFKIFGQKICTDEVTGRSKNIDDVVAVSWEMWIIRGGAVAFNHADGSVLIFKGNSPPALGPVAPAPSPSTGFNGYAQSSVGLLSNAPSTMLGAGNGYVANGGSVAQWAGGNGYVANGGSVAQWAGGNGYASNGGAVAQWAGGAAAARNASLGGPIVSMIEKCPQEGMWFKFYNPVGMPHQKDGDYNSCPWLTSKNCWKAAMGDRANILREILTKYQIYPPCPFCPQAGDFPGHLPAQKHYQALCHACLVPGRRIIDISKECFQCWAVPGGSIRFNHVSGEISACRGSPQSDRDRAFALPERQTGMGNPQLTGPAAPFALTAESASQLGAASQTAPPQPVPAMLPPTAPAAPAASVREPNVGFGLNGPRPPPDFGQPWQVEAPTTQAEQAPAEDAKAEGHWIWLQFVQESLQESMARLSSQALGAGEVECIVCGMEFDLLTALHTHLLSPAHFTKLFSMSGYHSRDKKARQLYQQFANGALRLNHWTLELEHRCEVERHGLKELRVDQEC